MTHRVLIVGGGSIGERHLRCFAAIGRAEVGLCEVDAEKRQAVAARCGVTQVFADLNGALAEKWSAAVIATPAHAHVPLAIQAAVAGVHLFIEKPLATAEARIDELMREVSKRQLVAGVGYVYRSHPGLTAMRQALHSGKFGKPAQLVAVTGQHFPTYRPAYRNTYYTNRASGGGAIQDALTHILNAGEWLIGPIDRLCADASHQVLDGVEVEDTAHVIARQGRAMSSYSLNQFQSPNEATITVNCDGGSLRMELHAGRWRWMTERGGEWHDEPWPKMERDDWFIRQANFFLDALEGKAPVLCTIEEGLQTLRVNLAALASADHGGTPQVIGRAASQASSH